MISPHTKPGTHVVCVDATPTFEAARSHVLPEFWPLLATYYAGNVASLKSRLGQVYVVASIEPHRMAVTGYVVRVQELKWCYPLGCFRVAELPSCLTALLRTAPETVS